jgi:RNA polymerase sigma-70 factor (ECF subfamily)
VNTEPDVLKTSWTLVARLKNLDDRDRWREFYDLYRGLIMGVARKAGLREEEAQEVLQETMSSVSKNIGDFEANPAQGSFHAWLLTMTRWRIMDQFKKRTPFSASRQMAADSTDTTPTIERIPDPQGAELEKLCDEEWNRQLLGQALAELQASIKAEHYQIFHLLTIQQKPVMEVARMLGKNAAQIYLIKHRAGRELQAILKKLNQRLG